MTRLFPLCFLVACWRGGDPQPQPAQPIARHPIQVEPTTCDTFDSSNRACRTTCLEGAPDDWPGCAAATDRLVAQGYACTSHHPRSCTLPSRPPTACATCSPITTRVIANRITGTTMQVTVGAGSDQGVTMSWRATLLDGGRRLPGGIITLVRIDHLVSIGSVRVTSLPSPALVLLEP